MFFTLLHVTPKPFTMDSSHSIPAHCGRDGGENGVLPLPAQWTRPLAVPTTSPLIDRRQSSTPPRRQEHDVHWLQLGRIPQYVHLFAKWKWPLEWCGITNILSILQVYLPYWQICKSNLVRKKFESWQRFNFVSREFSLYVSLGFHV